MAVIYAVLVIVAASIMDAFAKSLLISTGSAIFRGGLVFFLIRMFHLNKEYFKKIVPDLGRGELSPSQIYL
jgi:hypothetical protein